MPVYASGPEFDAALQAFKDACAAEGHAVNSLTAAMQSGADFQTLRMLTEAMERTGAEKMRLLHEMKRFEIGE
ncbi:MAG: hypothetical protein LWW96_14375 [Acidovorax sp.]|uniref:hypothetical protein n=1 Tax=Acidovorax sp. TaxID=1872122 RepID=UPI0025C1B338|nr:hypothetical protein [Acidovorax sp.]MCE1193329.1 hypothetical protein [Acidovorax sp.]